MVYGDFYPAGFFKDMVEKYRGNDEARF